MLLVCCKWKEIWLCTSDISICICWVLAAVTGVQLMCGCWIMGLNLGPQQDIKCMHESCMWSRLQQWQSRYWLDLKWKKAKFPEVLPLTNNEIIRQFCLVYDCSSRGSRVKVIPFGSHICIWCATAPERARPSGFIALRAEECAWSARLFRKTLLKHWSQSFQ